MKKILFVHACARPQSRTYRLAQHVLHQLEGEITQVDLYKEKKLLPLDGKRLDKRNECIAAGDFQNEIFDYARQFAQADEIVIAAPYWDLLFPAVLRTYLELVTVTGVTFSYTEEGEPVGLCKARKLVYVTTAGGAIGKYNFGYTYVKALADAFYGIPETLCVKAENLDIVGVDPENILQRVMEETKMC